MSSARLLRLGALAAIVAGGLRAATSFLGYSAPTLPKEILYLTIDLSILFGLLAIYAYQHVQSGIAGFVGFVLGVTGAAIIAGPDGTLGGVSMYVVGALLLSVGMMFLAAGSWRAGKLPRYVPLCWVGSTILGVGGFLLGGSSVSLLLAGLAFGAGFIGAGITIWSDPELRDQRG